MARDAPAHARARAIERSRPWILKSSSRWPAAWLLLILLPRRAAAVNLVAGAIVPGLLAAAYVTIIVPFWNEATGGFSSLAGVAGLFEHRWLLLAGWIHYLAFDLLIGRWELLDAQARGVHHALVVPCLLATFLFGPAGWLAYLGLRRAVVAVRRRTQDGGRAA